MDDHLFVYGSLRRGSDGRVHPLLAPACIYVTTAYYRGILYDLGPYPAVVPSERTDDRVTGELYRMDEPARVLAQLDAYEGAQYARERTEVTRDDGGRNVDLRLYGVARRRGADILR